MKSLKISFSKYFLLFPLMGMLVSFMSCTKETNLLDSTKSFHKSKSTSIPLIYGYNYTKYSCMDEDSAKVILTSASLADRAWFWRTKMHTEASATFYSPAQLAIIKHMEILVDSAYFNPAISTSDLAIVDHRIMQEIRTNFQADTAKQVFASNYRVKDCDPVTDPDCRKKVINPGAPGGESTDATLCGCNTVSDYCWTELGGCSGTCNIDTEKGGCGTMWNYPCQGSCK